ncbi:MAG: hypothetical protein DI629_14480 [Mesorhizobium amorphae]|nr:MAG: hypothetical protein DI629_14480 [Mesorhizobium amorphae]
MERAVLVVTHADDDHAPLVIRRLEALGIDTVRFDTECFGKTDHLGFEMENGRPAVRLDIGGRELSGNRIASILFRHIRIPTASHVEDPEARRLAASEERALLEGGLLALEPSIWLNHPHANRGARSKLLQLRWASRLGFRVPDTVVTADPERIREMHRRWEGRMVAKLAGGQLVGSSVDDQYVIHTSEITAQDLEDADALRACPAIYQRRIEKRCDARVTVVGDAIFACRIHSQDSDTGRTDWRAAGSSRLRHEPFELDAASRDRCRALMTALGLEIAGLDFVVGTDGELTFLEINAAGQWAWIEEMTGLPIAAAIAQRLAEPVKAGTGG